MQSWAAQDDTVAAVVASVDAGVERTRATHRATFLYWAYLGQAAVMDAGGSSIPLFALADLARLLKT